MKTMVISTEEFTMIKDKGPTSYRVVPGVWDEIVSGNSMGDQPIDGCLLPPQMRPGVKQCHRFDFHPSALTT